MKKAAGPIREACRSNDSHTGLCCAHRSQAALRAPIVPEVFEGIESPSDWVGRRHIRFDLGCVDGLLQRALAVSAPLVSCIDVDRSRYAQWRAA
jgi:hypothetical protein